MLDLLAQVRAVVSESHIVYTSGKHGTAYVNKDAIYPHAHLTSQLCLQIAEAFKNSGVEAVLAPAIGAVILSQWVAFHLTNLLGREVLGVYAEKMEDGFVIKRGYDQLIRNKKTLIVEDILTTGGSVRKVIEAARAVDADVIGVAALCNRGGITEVDLLSIPRLCSLLSLPLESWDESECPMCKKGIPINTDVGKGREYLARKQR